MSKLTLEEYNVQADDLLKAGDELLEESGYYKNHPDRRPMGLYATGTKGRSGFGEWLIALADNDKAKLAEFGSEQKLLQVGLGSAGGFTVPTQFVPQLLSIPGEASIVRPRALVIPMEGETVQIPSLDQTLDPGAKETHRFGGVELHWTEEGAAKTETEPAFKLVSLHLHELSGFTYVTDRLLRASALALDAVLTRLFGDAIADEADYCYIQGSGAGMPQGVISAGATIQVVRAGAGHIIYADVLGMYHAFLHNRGVWLINPCCIEDILTLKNPTTNDYLWAANASGDVPVRLLGYPIIWTDKMSALGTKGDIGLFDFSRYVIGEGGAIVVDASPHYQFIKNQTTFRFFLLTDGTPWLSAPLYTRGGDYQVSPLVTLATYAA